MKLRSSFIIPPYYKFSQLIPERLSRMCRSSFQFHRPYESLGKDGIIIGWSIHVYNLVHLSITVAQ